jgi:hypothetical protein
MQKWRMNLAFYVGSNHWEIYIPSSQSSMHTSWINEMSAILYQHQNIAFAKARDLKFSLIRQHTSTLVTINHIQILSLTHPL